MRTTLDIDDDLLQAAKELGVPLVPRRAPDVPRPTMALVNRLRDSRATLQVIGPS